MFVVTALYEVEGDHVTVFRAALTKQAEVTRQREVGCRRFDVSVDPAMARRFFAYQLFADEAAFQQHLDTEHFQTFDRLTAPWVETATVNTWELAVSPGWTGAGAAAP